MYEDPSFKNSYLKSEFHCLSSHHQERQILGSISTNTMMNGTYRPINLRTKLMLMNPFQELVLGKLQGKISLQNDHVIITNFLYQFH